MHLGRLIQFIILFTIVATFPMKIQAFTYAKDCKGQVKVSSIPDTPLEGMIEGQPFKLREGYVEDFLGDTSVKFFSEDRVKVCSPLEKNKKGNDNFLTIKGPLEQKNYTYDEASHALFYFGYTYYQGGSPISITKPLHGVVIFDQIGTHKGDKITGRMALCHDEKESFVAGTFSIDRCF